MFGSLIREAARAETNDAAAASGGPLTYLLNAKGIEVELSVEDWEGEPPYIDLNPQHPVLHKFVTDCATQLGYRLPNTSNLLPMGCWPPHWFCDARTGGSRSNSLSMWTLELSPRLARDTLFFRVARRRYWTIFPAQNVGNRGRQQW